MSQEDPMSNPFDPYDGMMDDWGMALLGAGAAIALSIVILIVVLT